MDYVDHDSFLEGLILRKKKMKLQVMELNTRYFIAKVEDDLINKS